MTSTLAGLLSRAHLGLHRFVLSFISLLRTDWTFHGNAEQFPPPETRQLIKLVNVLKCDMGIALTVEINL